MEKMADKLADRFYNRETFPDMSYGAFKYVMEFALEMAAGILASAAIAVAFDMEMETAVFLLIFWVLRSYAGGIHLDRFSHCFLFSTGVIAGAMALVKYCHPPLGLPSVLFFIGIVAFFATEPESDKNREVNREEDLFFKRRLRQFLFIIMAAYLIVAFTGSTRYAFIIALAVDVVYVLMILGKVKNGKI